MPRPKGLPKTGGRKKGTPNKPKLPVSRAVPGNVVVVTTHEALGKLGGSQSEAWNDAIALQVVNALWLKDPAARHKQASAMLVGLNGISPRDELEGMIVAQLITARNAAGVPRFPSNMLKRGARISRMPAALPHLRHAARSPESPSWQGPAEDDG